MGLEHTLTISQAMIDAYRFATGDTNDLHQKCALGFQESFILEHAAREDALAKNPESICYLAETTFLAPVPSNSEVTYATTPADQFARTINAELLRAGKPAARSEFHYGTNGNFGPAPDAICAEAAKIEEVAKKAHAELDLAPAEYTLSSADARSVAFGIAKRQELYRELAVSRASEPMLSRGREIIYAQREGGSVPVYAKHRIILMPESVHLTENNKLQTYVSFTKVPFAKGERPEQYIAHVFSETTDKTPLFAATLELLFVKEKLMNRALR